MNCIDVVIYLFVQQQMQSEGEGWQALSQVSCFMTHVEMRKSLSLFGEIDATLDYCEYLTLVEIHKSDEPRLRSKKRKKQLREDFIHAVKSLSLSQLIYYYNILVEQLINLANNINKAPHIDTPTFLVTECFTRSYSLKMWKKKKLRFDRENHIVYAEKDKKIKIYDLGNFILRRSNTTDYFCIVLEAINNVPHERSRTVHIGFEIFNIFRTWFHSIQASVQYKQWVRLAEMMNKRHLIGSANEVQTRVEESNRTVYEPEQMSSPSLRQNSSLEEKKRMKKTTSIQQSQTSKDFQSTGSVSNISEVKLTNFDDKVLAETSYKKQFHIDEQKILKESFIFRLLNQKLQISFEQLQFQLQTQQELIKNSKKKILFSKLILGDQNLNELDDLSEFERLQIDLPKTHEFAGELSIYQGISEQINFKFFYKSPTKLLEADAQLDVLANHLLDPHSHPIINPFIKSVSIKTVIFSQNSTINYQQNNALNRLYRPRDFVYLRHVVRDTKNQIFIIDRSIKQDLLPENEQFVRGELLNICRISQKNGQIILLMDMSLFNRGDLSQDINHSKSYINKFALGLSEFFKQKRQPNSKMKFYNLHNPINFPEAIDEPTLEQIINEKIVQIAVDPAEVPLETARKTKKKDRKSSSFYQITRDNLVTENQGVLESMYIGEQDEGLEHVENITFRKTYEPPRKTSNDYLNPKLPFLNVKEEAKYDWKSVITPSWKQNWSVDEDAGGLVHKSSSTKDRQKLRKVLEEVAKKTLTGKSLNKLSFPVDILVPESNLERMVKSLSYAPTLFDDCHQLPLMDKFKKGVTFSILTSLLSLQVDKSFDPFLGQTYQGEISHNCQGYAQQISVDPPLSALYLLGSGYSLSACVEQRIKILMNSASGQILGVYRIKFRDESQICFTLPGGELKGLIYNNRSFLLQGKAYYWMEKECIVLQLNFSANNSFLTAQTTKQDSFQGIIYEVTPSFMRDFLLTRQKPADAAIVRALHKVSGRWTKFISFDGETIHFDNIRLYEMGNEIHPLFSDCSYREDINYLKKKKLETAQTKKEEMEERQRKDQMLREEAAVE